MSHAPLPCPSPPWTAWHAGDGQRPAGWVGVAGKPLRILPLRPLFLGPLLRGNLLLVGAQLSWQELQPCCLCKDQPALPRSRGKQPSPGGSWPWSAHQAVCAIQGV